VQVLVRPPCASALLAQLTALHQFVEKEPRVRWQSAIALVLAQ